MEKSYFFNARMTDGSPDRTYTAADFADREACLLSDGVVGGRSLTVTGASGGIIYVSPGAAVISGYTYHNTDTLKLSVASADPKLPRIDTVALRLTLNGRTINATVVKGTPSANPVPPQLEDTSVIKYMPLADILVSEGEALISESDITDRRVIAGYASSREELLLMLREYLGELEPVNADELAKLREIIKIVKSDKGDDSILCGDGKYRKVPVLRREIAMEFRDPGIYNFVPSMHPSENGFYDIEVQGAGGGGGSHNGTGMRGGGGGAGAYITASNVRLGDNLCTVVVGRGGKGVPGADGEDGGSSRLDGFIAGGGSGGAGGSGYGGGAGGDGMCCGWSGLSGEPVSNGNLTSDCGKGGDSQFGIGASAPEGNISCPGNNASSPGTGGSGASCLGGMKDMAGGSGGHGVVIIYRYVISGFEEE